MKFEHRFVSKGRQETNNTTKTIFPPKFMRSNGV